MNIRDYEYIVQIALYGNISKAAERLNITTAALSKYLSRIENELDVRLFDRKGNQIALTKAGQRYIETGKKILELDQLLMNDMDSIRNSGDSAIRIGIPRAMTNFIMEEIFPVFMEENKGVSLFLERGGSGEMTRLLEDGKLDIVFIFVSEFKPSLKYEKLADIPTVLAVPADSKLLSKTFNEAGSSFKVLYSDDWLEEPFIEMTNVSIQGVLADQYFAAKGRRPPARICVGDSLTALAAIENGLGNSIVLASPCQDRMVKFLKVPDLELSMEFYSVVRNREYLSDSTESLIRIVKNAFLEY